MASSGDGTAIGIDFGTMYSRVAVWRNGKVEIICNENGDRMTPSWVAFTDSERLIGDDAKKQAIVNQKNTIFGVKRMLGRQTSSQISKDLRFYPIAALMSTAEYEPPKLKVSFKGKMKTLSPEEISAMMLAKMKEIAEDHLGFAVKDAVIAIPSFFNQIQRQATIDAATIAGLNVLRLINEPTAAALAYELSKGFVDIEENQSVLVYCLGAGFTSISVINIRDGTSFEVKSTTGNTNLGGEDFDNCLVTYLMDEFKRNFKQDLSSNSTAKLRLKTAAEEAKKTLSLKSDATIVLDALKAGISFNVTISRARFEELCIDLFRSTLKLVEQALKDAEVETSDIHDVVLVGESTRIPKIQQLLQDFFSGKELHKPTNLSESVVYGAAVQAANMGGDTSEHIPKVNIIDISPLAIGTSKVNKENSFKPFFVPNTPIPFNTTSTITTTKDNQDSIKVPLFMLDPSDGTENELCHVTLENIPPAPARQPSLEVSYDIDANGILRVSRIGNQGDQEPLHIAQSNGSRLTHEQVKRLSREAAKNKVEDDKRRKQIVARNRFEKYVSDVKQAAEEVSAKATAKYKEAIKWLDDNKQATEDEFVTGANEVQKVLQPLLQKLCAEVGDNRVVAMAPTQNDTDSPETSQGNGGPANKKRRNN